MKGKENSMKSKCSLLSVLAVVSVALTGCAGTETEEYDVYETPTVDYVAGLDVKNAPHMDSFLNQLAMNYRSYAMYNAETSGYPDIAELFAQKAVSAFSGETPFPENLNSWDVADDSERFEINNAYNDLMNEFQNGAVEEQPQLAAEAQAKFDCWISAAASNQYSTADECKKRFLTTVQAIRDCADGAMVSTQVASEKVASKTVRKSVTEKYYPETRRLNSMSGLSRTRDGVVIVNNVNVAPTLVQPVPVPTQHSHKSQTQPFVFNQNIYGGDENATSGDEVFSGSDSFDNSKTVTNTKTATDSFNDTTTKTRTVTNTDSFNDSKTKSFSSSDSFNDSKTKSFSSSDSFNDSTSKTFSPSDSFNDATTQNPVSDNGDYVSRDEFIDLMMAMREELAAINSRLDNLNNKPVPAQNKDKTVIKVQQIPLEPKQRIMEEIFEIRFDFDKSAIKPEYEDVIRKLAATTQANKNVKVSVVGHTDTVGSQSYNYALGGRRAEAVQKMLIEYGIPASQIVAVSAGKEDLKVWTPDNTPNAANRRVRVVKETQYTEQPQSAPMPVVVEEYTETEECENCEYE